MRGFQNGAAKHSRKQAGEGCAGQKCCGTKMAGGKWIGRAREWAGYRALSCIAKAGVFLRGPLGDALGPRLGDAARILSPHYRHLVLANMRQAFGREKSEAEIQALMRSFYRHMGRAVIGFARGPHLSDEQIKRLVFVQGVEHLDRALSARKGAIIVSAHMGCWEVAVRRVVLEGYRMNGIVRTQADAALAGALNRSRSTARLGIIPKSGAVAAAVERLARNECVIFVVDENAGSRGVFAPFFGKLASTAAGPVVAAARSGAPIVPAFAFVKPDGSHGIEILPSLDVRFSDDFQEDLVHNTTLINRAIEDAIRRHPEQWLWALKRWRTRPPGETAAGGQ